MQDESTVLHRQEGGFLMENSTPDSQTRCKLQDGLCVQTEAFLTRPQSETDIKSITLSFVGGIVGVSTFSDAAKGFLYHQIRRRMRAEVHEQGTEETVMSEQTF